MSRERGYRPQSNYLKIFARICVNGGGNESRLAEAEVKEPLKGYER